MPRNKFGFDRQLGGRKAQRFTRVRFRNPVHFKQHVRRTNHRDPAIQRRLALAHPGFQRLLRVRFLWKHPDPHLALALHVAITRHMKRKGKMWIRVFPQKSYTKKPLETRMGKGKAPLDGWVAVIRPANVLFEVDGVTEADARESLRLAATKLPIKTKFISRHHHAS